MYFLSPTPSRYICIELLTSLYPCHYSQQCRVWKRGQPLLSFLLFFLHSVHTHVSLCGSMGGCSERERNLIKSGVRLLLSPTRHHPTTAVYNITPPPTSFLLLNFSFLTYYVFVGGHCLSCSGNFWLVFAAKGNLLLYFCFYFVKLIIHIVLEPPATIKTVKKLSCLVPKVWVFWFSWAFEDWLIPLRRKMINPL